MRRRNARVRSFAIHRHTERVREGPERSDRRSQTGSQDSARPLEEGRESPAHGARAPQADFEICGEVTDDDRKAQLRWDPTTCAWLTGWSLPISASIGRAENWGRTAPHVRQARRAAPQHAPQRIFVMIQIGFGLRIAHVGQPCLARAAHSADRRRHRARLPRRRRAACHSGWIRPWNGKAGAEHAMIGTGRMHGCEFRQRPRNRLSIFSNAGSPPSRSGASSCYCFCVPIPATCHGVCRLRRTPRPRHLSRPQQPLRSTARTWLRCLTRRSDPRRPAGEAGRGWLSRSLL